MVTVSRESASRTHERLSRCIGAAEFHVLEGVYAYTEHAVTAFPAEHARDALAFVRDEAVWSVLGPARGTEPELFKVFAFHFPQALDNSGFVGWLATRLKAAIGTGVLVVCGSNSARGGIFDYWGVPVGVADAAEAEIRRLIEDGTA